MPKFLRASFNVSRREVSESTYLLLRTSWRYAHPKRPWKCPTLSARQSNVGTLHLTSDQNTSSMVLPKSKTNTLLPTTSLECSMTHIISGAWSDENDPQNEMLLVLYGSTAAAAAAAAAAASPPYFFIHHRRARRRWRQISSRTVNSPNSELGLESRGMLLCHPATKGHAMTSRSASSWTPTQSSSSDRKP